MKRTRQQGSSGRTLMEKGLGMLHDMPTLDQLGSRGALHASVAARFEAQDERRMAELDAAVRCRFCGRFLSAERSEKTPGVCSLRWCVKAARRALRRAV